MGKDIIGLLLVIAGVGLAAGFASRNGKQIDDGLVVKGRAAVSAGKVAPAFKAYCDARDEAKLPNADGCSKGPWLDTLDGVNAAIVAAMAAKAAPPADETAKAPEKKPTYDELVAGGRAKLAAVSTTDETLPKAVAEKRAAWIAALEGAIEPGAAAKTTDLRVAPSTRVSEWFSVGGLMFLLGLGLIVGGSVLARQAAKEKAAAEPAESPTPQANRGPRDFGVMLQEARDEVAKLLAIAQAETDPPDEAFETLRGQIETLQFELIEPLIDARGRVQVRHGMAAFAAIYSPLSGGERNLNRAWSALVDEHWPEATNALLVASHQLKTAHDELNQAISAAA